MSHPRVSIAGLLVLVFFCGIAFGALRYASDTWASAMLVLALGILGIAAFRAMSDGEGQAFWKGFAVIGGIYMLLCLGPWLGTHVGAHFPTTRLLDRLYSVVHLARDENAVIPRGTFDESFSAWAEAHPSAQAIRLTLAEEDFSTATISWVTPRLNAFQRVGHSILALVFGYVAGLLAWYRSSLRKQSEPWETRR